MLALMFKITFITVGSLPKGPFTAIGDDFTTRLKKFAEIELKSVKTDDRLIEAIPKGSFVIALEATGKQYSSENFAAKLQNFIDNGQKLTVILGGPHGIPVELKAKANLLLSLSPMTTTHDLAHLFFLEQLYRAFTITKGMTYHY
ncbi:MAG: rRNA (pseudouridine1915-N3)-methyltransferase [Patescibacteria group bacterium]|jgi:23S rRNA (pseudouridine1915-N3)-methyltransferase|nr:rRNA (pseudouridine1915-N3)-methyltransferase [Patescibacteria group bacterium]